MTESFDVFIALRNPLLGHWRVYRNGETPYVFGLGERRQDQRQILLKNICDAGERVVSICFVCHIVTFVTLRFCPWFRYLLTTYPMKAPTNPDTAISAAVTPTHFDCQF